jgi:hypothetical protein
MNTPVPLRADYREAARIERRAWARAITATALASAQRSTPSGLLRATWPGDARAASILKAAVSPTSTSDYPAQDVIGAFRSLSPGSAAWRLFDHPSALQLDLSGLHQINIPHVASMAVAPVFVAEGAPGPALQWSFAKHAVGPVRKILVMSAVTEEIEATSPQNASQIVGRVLSDATTKSVDAVAFDANAASSTRPAGLLNGVAATTAATAGATLAETVAKDMANLVGAIAATGIDPDGVQFIAGAREAELMKTLVGADNVLMSLGVPAKTVIAVAPAGLASGYQGPPTIETSKETAIHYEDANPLPVVSASPTTVAAPTRSAFQSGLVVVRVRAECAWSAAPGSVQFASSVNW